MYFRLFSLCSIIICATTSAQESLENTVIENHSPLTSEVEFGFQSHTGNTDSQALNARVNSQYISGRHRHFGEFKLYQLNKDGIEDKFQLTFEAQSDYKLGPGLYLYGGFRGIDSRHSAYFKDYTLSSGLGYQLANSDELLIEFEAGPGFRYQDPNLEHSSDDFFSDTVQESIFRGQMNSSWQLLDNFSLSAKLTLVSGQSNSKLDSQFSAINDITDDIALKIVHEKQYHDKVPEGASRSESSLSINLLVTF